MKPNSDPPCPLHGVPRCSQHPTPGATRSPRCRLLVQFPILLTAYLVAWIGTGRCSAQATESTVHRIEDGGQARNFVVAQDEIQVTAPASEAGTRRLSQTEPRADVVQQVEAIRRAGGAAELVVYPQGQPRTKANRRVLTRRVTVRLAPGTDAAALAARHGATTQGELPFAPGYAVFVAPEAAGAPPLAEALRREPGVLYAQPMLGQARVRKMVPNDLRFGRQWVLRNTGQNGALAGVDVNVAGVWDTYRGKGILINIVDDGLEHTHPDLAANCNTQIDYDYRDGDDDPAPAVDGDKPDTHGTAVGGVCAAVGNNAMGVAGSGWEATLVGIRLIGGDSIDELEAMALAHSNSIVHISNNSWGGDDDAKTKGGAGPLALAALQQGVERGRGGRGTIFMWAAGNGGTVQDNANYDSYNSSIQTISVGALNDRGARASYSEPGACLVVVAPAGGDPDAGREQATITTDLAGDFGENPAKAEAGFGPVWPQEVEDPDYTQGFNGTSSAAPLASGVVALVLQANPALGWRDVQEVLMRSATKVSPDHQDWITNAAGFHFNHDFGAGLINARGAVDTALAWQNLAPQQAVERSLGGLAIPDNNAAGLVREFDLGDTNLRVEQVTVAVELQHPSRGDLQITLTSPAGTVSRLMEVHDDPNADLKHTFESVFNWGENSRGVWQVRLADGRAGSAGSLQGIQVKVFGSEAGGTGGGDDLGALEISYVDDDLVIAWDAAEGGKLETAPAVGGPWTPVTGPEVQSGTYTVDVTASPSAFYRLRK